MRRRHHLDRVPPILHAPTSYLILRLLLQPPCRGALRRRSPLRLDHLFADSVGRRVSNVAAIVCRFVVRTRLGPFPPLLISFVSYCALCRGGGAGGISQLDEFGIDPTLEPELAMALRISMEEERARRRAAGGEGGDEGAQTEGMDTQADAGGTRKGGWNGARSVVRLGLPSKRKQKLITRRPLSCTHRRRRAAGSHCCVAAAGHTAGRQRRACSQAACAHGPFGHERGGSAAACSAALHGWRYAIPHAPFTHVCCR